MNTINYLMRVYGINKLRRMQKVVQISANMVIVLLLCFKQKSKNINCKNNFS
jgi:hypothetical protein